MDSATRPPAPIDSARPTLPPPPVFPVAPLAGRVDARREGGVVKVALSITNISADSIVVLFANGQEFDFRVTRNGETLWTWSRLIDFAPAPHSKTWAPHQTRTFSAEWRGPGIPNSALVAVGMLTSSNRPVERIAPVIVVP